LTKRAAAFFLLQRQDKKYAELSERYRNKFTCQKVCATLEKALLMFNRPTSLAVATVEKSSQERN
jgi:hypothetical protein